MFSRKRLIGKQISSNSGKCGSSLPTCQAVQLLLTKALHHQSKCLEPAVISKMHRLRSTSFGGKQRNTEMGAPLLGAGWKVVLLCRELSGHRDMLVWASHLMLSAPQRCFFSLVQVFYLKFAQNQGWRWSGAGCQLVTALGAEDGGGMRQQQDLLLSWDAQWSCHVPLSWLRHLVV